MVTTEVFFATVSTLVVVAAGAFFWILSEIRAERKERKAEREEDRQERRADTQRIMEGIYFHRHDSAGTAVFYPPAPTTPAN